MQVEVPHLERCDQYVQTLSEMQSYDFNEPHDTKIGKTLPRWSARAVLSAPENARPLENAVVMKPSTIPDPENTTPKFHICICTVNMLHRKTSDQFIAMCPAVEPNYNSTYREHKTFQLFSL